MSPPSAPERFAAHLETVRLQVRSWWSWLRAWGPDLLLTLLAAWVITVEFQRTLPTETLFDMGSQIGSGQAAARGLNPYGIYPGLTYHFTGAGWDVWNPNLNPPITGLLFQLFTLAEPHLVFRIWYLVTAALYAATIFLLLRRYHVAPRLVFAMWACALAGFWETLLLGQIYVPLALATVIAWLLLERGEKNWAGILIGIVVAVKPNFAVWPALLFLSGYRRPAIISGITVAVLSAVPAVLLGPQVYRQWLELVASDTARGAFVTNASLSGLALRAGLPLLGTAVSAALLGGAAWWAWARRRAINEIGAIGLLVALLASPVAWVHYTLFLLPVLCAYWRVRGMRLVAAALMIPVTFVSRQSGAPTGVQLTLGSVYGWTLVLLLGVLVAHEHRKAGLLGSAEPTEATAAGSSAGSELDAATHMNPWSPRGPNLLIAIVALVLLVPEFLRTLPGDRLLDFGSFVASAEAASKGLNPFGDYPLTFHFALAGKTGWNPNLNPPISAMLFQAFRMFEPHRMFRIWYVVSALMYGTIILLLLRRYKEAPRVTFALCACAMAGLWETLSLGQVYIPLVLAAVGAWLLLEDEKPIPAGILIGVLVALKPNFAVWPLLLLLAGRFRPSLIAIAVAALISAVPAFAFGPEIYQQWLTVLMADPGRPLFLTNASLFGLAARADLPMWGIAAGVLLLGASAGWALLRRPPIRELSALALIVSLLTSPIAWVHYTLFLLPVICWRWSSPIIRLATAFFLVPAPFVVSELADPGFRMLTRGSLYNWALLLFFAGFVFEELRRNARVSLDRPATPVERALA